VSTNNFDKESFVQVFLVKVFEGKLW